MRLLMRLLRDLRRVDPALPELFLTERNRLRPGCAPATSLLSAFPWSDTTQGHTFWSAANQKLADLAPTAGNEIDRERSEA